MGNDPRPDPAPPLTYGRLPAVSPEAMLEDYWRYLDLSPEERQRDIGRVCRTAMSQWWAKSFDERARIEFAKSWNADTEILERWAREFRERARG